MIWAFKKGPQGQSIKRRVQSPDKNWVLGILLVFPRAQAEMAQRRAS